MARASVRLAKLTPPRLHRAAPRDRLFERLDEARAQRGGIYLSGPPGAGKTTLAATWIAARDVRGIWLQIDAGDADLPTFFHYLREAAAPFRGRNRPELPALTPEYLSDVSGYARRFFRDLFARLPAGAVVVLDNCHEVADEHPLHGLIAAAVAEVPTGQAVVLISRNAPLPEHARLIASERLAVLDRRDLGLTLDEATAMARQRGVHDLSPVTLWHERSAGWAAGFTLLLEGFADAVAVMDAEDADRLRTLFDYFAGQVFDRLSQDAQRQLLMLGFLPRMTRAEAAAMAGTEAAGALLQDLHRRQWFTERRPGGEPVYQFHALFRTFLEDRAARLLSPEERRSLWHRAGSVLEAAGRAEDAVPAYLEAGSHRECGLVIVREAPRLISEGRWRVVVAWIDRLPREWVARDARLTLWLGMAKLSVATAEARQCLESAFALATDDADEAGRALAAAGIVETCILEYATFRALDPWIDVLQESLPRGPAFDSPAAELRVQAAMLIALAYRRPASAYLGTCVERVETLVRSDAPANLRLTAAAYLLAYGTTTGPLIVAHRALASVEALIAHPEASALSIAWASFILAHYHILCGNERESRRASDRVELVATERGLPFVLTLAHVIRGWLECELGNLEAAQSRLDALEGSLDRSRSYDLASLHSLRMLIAYLGGQAERAMVEGTRAVELFDHAGSIMHRLLNRDLLASAALALHRHDEAARVLHDLRRVAGEARPTWLEGRIRLHEALALLDGGDEPAGLEALREGFQSVRQHGTEPLLRFARPVMARIAAHALRRGIDVSYVRDLIRREGWPAPGPDIEAWPWPVEVRTLGTFSVLVNGEPLRFTHKVPRKPILLLKAIIALGGRDVREERLTDALWPNESGDAAHESFGQALMRLRRLLENPAAVTLTGGRVSLDASRVWIDATAFDHLASGSDIAGVDLDRVLALYRGDFLADEPDQPWSASMRERLRGRFLHLVGALGKRLERDGHWEAAARLYLRGLDADNLAESFYQGLMRCHVARGLPSEALSVYRRLRHQLSVVLGVEPSDTTIALARELSGR